MKPVAHCQFLPREDTFAVANGFVQPIDVNIDTITASLVARRLTPIRAEVEVPSSVAAPPAAPSLACRAAPRRDAPSPARRVAPSPLCRRLATPRHRRRPLIAFRRRASKSWRRKQQRAAAWSWARGPVGAVVAWSWVWGSAQSCGGTE